MSDINKLDSRTHSHIAELHAFDVASRHGSLTRAAQQLNLTQPALSQKIRRLESFVGEPLFLRQNRGVKLTEAGKLLYQATHNNLADLHSIFEQLQTKKTTKRVRISTDFAFAGHWLIPRLANLRDAFQDLDIQVVTSQTPGSPLDIQSDLVISLQDTPKNRDTREGGEVLKNRENKETENKSHILFVEEVMAVCSPEFLNKNGPIPSAQTLNELPLLNLSASPEAPWHNWDSWFAKLGLKAQKHKASMSFSNYTLVLQAAVNHQGVALGWQGLVDDYIDKNLLVPACAETVTSNRAYTMSLQKGSRSHMRSIYDWIVQQC